jgi:phospholipid/cholesterol/gamma-HCH transport system permease protein
MRLLVSRRHIPSLDRPRATMDYHSDFHGIILLRLSRDGCHRQEEKAEGCDRALHSEHKQESRLWLQLLASLAGLPKSRNFLLSMATTDQIHPPPNERLVAAPVEVVAGVGAKSRDALQEVGSMFWFIINTVSETLDRVRRGRVPFRAASFFRHTERAGVGSVPLVAMVSFFLGLTMALLTGYQLQRFGTERLVPGLVAIAFTRELGPLLTGIMLAARIGASFTAELGTMQVSEEVEAIEAMGIGPLRWPRSSQRR